MKSMIKRVSPGVDTRYYDLFDKTALPILLILILVFILWPILEVLIKSFFPAGSLSLALYQDIYNNKSNLLFNSIFVATLSTFFTIIFALCISIYTLFTGTRAKKLISATLMLTMISPPFISALAYITLFGKRGFITSTLLGLNMNPYDWHGIVLMQIASNVSIAALIIMGMMSGIDKRLIEASLDLGESVTGTLKRVILPLARPGIVAAAFITFIKSIADFGTPLIIGGNFKMLASEAYLAVIGRGDFPMASALSVIIIIPSIIAFFVYRSNMKHAELMAMSSSKSVQSSNLSFNLGVGLRAVLMLFTWTFLIFMTLQYVSIFMSAISDYRSGQLIFTSEYIQEVSFSKMPSFFRSLYYAFIAAIATSVIGLLLSYYIERRRFKGAKSFDLIASLPYIIPGPFFGIGYVLAFNDYPLALTGTGLIVVLNCVFRQIPISTKAASATLSNISTELEDAARDLGASNFRIIRGIIMPLLKPAFLVSFVNTFTATMTTVGAIIFLITPSAKVATVELFNVIREGKYGLAAVLACMIITATLLINVVFSRLLLRETKNG
jgi:iron(III) transport system permease protein